MENLTAGIAGFSIIKIKTVESESGINLKENSFLTDLEVISGSDVSKMGDIIIIAKNFNFNHGY